MNTNIDHIMKTAPFKLCVSLRTRALVLDYKTLSAIVEVVEKNKVSKHPKKFNDTEQECNTWWQLVKLDT